MFESVLPRAKRASLILLAWRPTGRIRDRFRVGFVPSRTDRHGAPVGEPDAVLGSAVSRAELAGMALQRENRRPFSGRCCSEQSARLFPWPAREVSWDFTKSSLDVRITDFEVPALHVHLSG